MSYLSCVMCFRTAAFNLRIVLKGVGDNRDSISIATLDSQTLGTYNSVCWYAVESITAEKQASYSGLLRADYHPCKHPTAH